MGGDPSRGRRSGGAKPGKRLRSTRLSFDPLEARRLMTAAPDEVFFQDLVDVDVVGRMLFYNNSKFDGNDAAATAADDAAIATDKSALLPGQTASFANYSSYSRGINGIMIDVAGLPAYSLFADDFTFKVGNSNDPGTWTDAPAPLAVTTRVGAGANGATRVVITWADGAIQKQWLQVTFKANTRTGLGADDVFYFGNAVGDSGNSAADAIVNSADQQGAVNNPANPAPITSVYDYNRDGVVNGADGAIAASNTTTSATALSLVAPPVPAPQQQYKRLGLELFNWGDGDASVYYAPAIVTTNAGTVLAFAEARSRTHDDAAHGVMMRRSTDGGLTWSDPVIVAGTAFLTGNGQPRVGLPTPVVDRQTGDVILVYNHTIENVRVTRSSDDGLTWSAGVDITSQVKVTAEGNPGPPGAYPDDPWGWNAVGPVHGIQLQEGPHAGRIVIPADHRIETTATGVSWSHVFYSDDGGATWHLGGGFHSDNSDISGNNYSNENTLVELPGGVMYMSIRRLAPQDNYRYSSVSTDGGITWSDIKLETGIRVPSVSGSLLRVNENTLIFSAPHNPLTNNQTRNSMSIWISKNNAQTWKLAKTVFFNHAAYSDLTMVGPDTFLLIYDRGHTGGGVVSGTKGDGDFMAKVGLARVNLRWLESNDPYEFSWYFNEEAAGTPANVGGASIQDYGRWDQRALVQVFGGAAPVYVQGSNNDTALQLAESSDRVILSQASNLAMQVDATRSFTVQIVMKTTDTNGIIIGTNPDIVNWTLEIVDGKVAFSLSDTINKPTITSLAAVNDGQWHRITAVRDVVADQLRLYVDGVEAAPAVTDTSTIPVLLSNAPVDPIVLGSYGRIANANELAFTVDTLRFTRAALTPDQFIPADFLSPIPPPDDPKPVAGPALMPGLRFWLPTYRPESFFSDYALYNDPLPSTPFVGMGTRSMYDLAQNFRVQVSKRENHLTFDHDDVVGDFWRFNVITNSKHVSVSTLNVAQQATPTGNFNFVQNTGVFTLSTFLKVEGETGSPMSLFDTTDNSTDRAGFSLYRQTNGSLTLTISATGSVVRVSSSTAAGSVQAGQWYHVAVVGRGAGKEIEFFITPVSADTVSKQTPAATMQALDGSYPASLGLTMGSRANGGNAFWGGMANQAFFDTSLSAAQIQHLFLYGKGEAAPAWQNALRPADINGNGTVTPQDLQIVVTRLQAGLLGDLPTPGGGVFPPNYFDASGDNRFTQSDLQRVVTALLSLPPANPAVAEPAAAEAAPAVPEAAPVEVASDLTATPLAAPFANGSVVPVDESGLAFAIALAAPISSAGEGEAAPDYRPEESPPADGEIIDPAASRTAWAADRGAMYRASRGESHDCPAEDDDERSPASDAFFARLGARFSRRLLNG